MGFSRRSALRLSGIALCSGMAGCSSYNPFGEKPSQVYITDITIVNLDTEPHLFDVMIRDAKTETVVFWERYTADAATKAENAPHYTTAGGTYWENPVSDSGEYVLYVDADREIAENDSEWETAKLTEQGDCVGLDVGIDQEGYLYISVKYPESCR
ncbi:hypothetical protein [Haloprofundus sp. MHR1]|uniref:hypothetical protein n=1 Tax=Haloprofundus sp. MHR1 TaxID=2572921 RepID=UPI0010BF29CF|nr:hypothetical protein [Haloprofundus sp. MHR1]QCJ45851.1 hypothetical protein FCF25_01380 [Haloprofundus sp. MHR1]